MQVVTHSYSSAGFYVANVTVSDSAFVLTSGTMVSSHSSGYAAPVSTVQFHVLAEDNDCFDFYASLSWSGVSCNSSGASLCAEISGGVQLNIGSKNSSITSAFSQLGELPTVSLSNWTHSYSLDPNSFSFSASDGYWTTTLDSSVLNSSSPIVASILQTINSTVLSCGIRSSMVDLTQPSASNALLGLDMSTSILSVIAASSLVSNSYSPGRLVVAQNHCVRSQTVAVFSRNTGGSYGYLGALMASSSDSFSTQGSLWDLTRDSNALRTTSHSLCGSLTSTQCQELNVFDVLIIDSTIVLLSSQGVFVSSTLPLMPMTTSSVNYTLVTTGYSTIDSSGTNTALLLLSGRSDCLSFSGSRFFIMFPSSQSAATVDSLLYTTINGALANSSTLVSVASMLSALSLSGSYNFVTAEYDVILGQNIYLLGLNTLSCAGRNCPYTTGVIVIHNTTSNTFTQANGVTATTRVVGLKALAGDNQFILYGSEIWMSYDGGNNWLVVFELSFSNSGTEYFVDAQSSPVGGRICLVTNLNNVYCGNTASAQFILITSTSYTSSGLSAVIADASGNMGVLVTSSSTYSSSTISLMPCFVTSVSGTLRGTILERNNLPISSLVDDADYSFASSLVPVFLSPSRVQLFALGSASPNIFHQYFTGMAVTLTNGGSAVINSVSSDGLVADCQITSTLISESPDQSPAVGATLTVTGFTTNLGDVTTMGSLSTSPSTITVTLTLSSLVSIYGWLYSDIGKTVVVNQASILITSLTSTTVATGSMVQLPYVQTTNTLTAKTGSWSIYDFRSFKEFAGNSAQSITLTSGPTSTTNTVTIQAGLIAFDSSLVNMVLLTSNGWGIVQYVTSATVAIVNTFSTFGSASYAAGLWSFRFPRNTYVLGSTQPATSQLTRGWRITIPNCDSQETLSLNVGHGVEYIDYKSNLTVSSGYPNNNQVIIQAPVVFTIRNPYVSSLALSDNPLKPNPSSSVAIQVVDTAKQGRSGVSVWYTGSKSLKCSNTIDQMQIVHGCPPTRYMTFTLPIPTEDFLTGNPTMFGSVPLVQKLVSNYRPPSSLGISVPTTKNIYNADPAASMYRTRFHVSKNSGEYKQCYGATSRAQCGCSDRMRLSMSVEYSDCIDRVLNVLYTKSYTPTLDIVQYNTPNSAVNGSYYLQELNGRVDYCISSSDCSNSTSLSNALFDPNSDVITWKGPELFHFRVTLVTNEYCSLSAQFMVQY